MDGDAAHFLLFWPIYRRRKREIDKIGERVASFCVKFLNIPFHCKRNPL